MLSTAKIAEICHEVNRAYCESLGDKSQVPWSDAPDWQRTSAVTGVSAVVNGTVRSPEQSHEVWLSDKISAGWRYGERKDAEKKEHPCIVPFEKLPKEQQTKDALFFAVVNACL